MSGSGQATRNPSAESEEVTVGMVPDSDESRSACLCAGCPSKADDDLSLYCVDGKSPAEVTRQLCACNWCPLWSGYGLTDNFYCDGGTTASSEAPEADFATEAEAGGDAGGDASEQ